MLTNGIILILASLGLAQACFLCIFLFTHPKGNRRANILLACILLGLTIRIGKSVLNYYFPLEAWQRNIGLSGILIVGPCLWLYGSMLIEKKNAVFKAQYFHFIPFILFVLLVPVIPSNGEWETYWNYGLMVFHLAIYLILSWVLLLRNRTQTSQHIFRWYRNILIGLTLVWAYYVGNFVDFNLHYTTGPIFYTFLIYAFSYLFLNRHHLSLEKYGSSNLDTDTSKGHLQKIRQLFLKEHLYLEPDLSLAMVANKLAISSREVSQVINENEGQNFNEFVNHYRIEKAKALLTTSSYHHEKIATIAYDVGFGTVTSFNVAFKKQTGMTPSLYRKQQLAG